MKVLALEIEVAGVRDEQFTAELLRAEAARAWQLYREGVVREAYSRADRDMAVLVLEAAGVEEARRVLATLPLVRAGLISFEVVPLAPYPGFERLFAG